MIKNIFKYSSNATNRTLIGFNLSLIKSNPNKYLNKSRYNYSYESKSRMSQSMINILIVFNKNDIKWSKLSSKESNYLLNSMKTCIYEMIGRHKYTIYGIDFEDIQSTNSWHSNTSFLITIGDQLTQRLSQMTPFSGTLINFGINDLLINSNDNQTTDLEFNSQYFKQQMSYYFNIDYEKNLNKSNFKETNETEVYLITKDKNDLNFIEKHKQCLESKIRLIDAKCGNSMNLLTNQTTINSKMDLIINANLENISFDTKTYFSNLKTTTIGQSLVFADITNTTMTLIEPFRGINGFVAIANQQTKGRGRNQNEWLSPKGCAMFTIQLSIPLNSNIGQKFSFVQHLAALSIVKGIKTISGYEELDIRVKWPNDVYCNKTKSKLSGILVTSILYNNKVNILIGCGINVYNSRPTLCLNDIIDNYNIQSLTKKLNHLKCEEVIARTLTQLEILLSTIEEHNGIEIIKDLYRKHWMHSSQSIKLIDNNIERLVTIEGLDNEGYLQVRDNSNGLVLSLHPDGNRFNIMHNLIVSAKH